MIIIPADKSNGRVEFPENMETPKQFYEVYTDNDNFYFFETKEERDQFYLEKGIENV